MRNEKLADITFYKSDEWTANFNSNVVRTMNPGGPGYPPPFPGNPYGAPPMPPYGMAPVHGRPPYGPPPHPMQPGPPPQMRGPPMYGMPPRGPYGGGPPMHHPAPYNPALVPHGPPPGGPPPAPFRPVKVQTTLYVGKISPSVSEPMMQELLRACGRLRTWRPMLDPETKKPKGFGFADYEDAHGVLRALRLLNGLSIKGSALLVKADHGTQDYLGHYVEVLRSDRRAKALEEKRKAAGGGAGDGAEGEAVTPVPSLSPQEEKELDAAAAQAEEEEDLVARGVIESVIGSAAPANAPRAPHAEDVTRFVDEAFRSGSAPPPPPPEGPGGGASAPSHGYAAASRRSRSRSPARDREKEQREREERERERDEREYQIRRRDWERSEDEKRRSREKEEERERELVRERERALRADEDVPDSDEEVEPWRRRPQRSRRGWDARRRARAREEAEDRADREKEEEGERQRRDAGEREAPGAAGLGAVPADAASDPILRAMLEAAGARGAIPASSIAAPSTASPAAASLAPPAVRLGGAGPAQGRGPGAAPGGSRSGVLAAFADDEEDKPRRPRLPLPPSMAEAAAAVTAGALQPQDPMQAIPSTWDQVRSYNFDWATFDRLRRDGLGDMMAKWVGRKVAELLGAEEPTMTEFIVSKVVDHTAPQSLYDEIHEVLDVETEGFLLKLYRMVSYEIAKARAVAS